MNEMIRIKNARIHNLKGIDVSIPKKKLTVITGVSGSGKSSLAFNTLYEEGRRRYLMFSGTEFMIDSVPSFDGITGGQRTTVWCRVVSAVVGKNRGSE